MIKRKLILLITAASISMVALIAIQVYWIDAAVETQHKKFDQSVMEAMSGALEKMEKEEAITKVTSKLFPSSEIDKSFHTDSVINIDQFPLGDPFQKQLITKKEPQRSDQLNIQFTPPITRDSSLFIIRKTQKRVLSTNINVDIKDQLAQKATLINEIVNELALISINNDYNERVSEADIKSLFDQELKKAGINTPHILDIFDAETQQLSFNKNKSIESDIINTPYRLSLMPNDYHIESDQLLLYFPKHNNYMLKNIWEILVLSFLLILILILLFYSSISTIFKQKQLSQVKNDFINNMTHELKTPISTISLACEALSDQSLNIDEGRKSTYIGMIDDENKRLSILVDNVLKSSVWDSTNLSLKTEVVAANDIIEKVAHSFRIQLSKKSGQLILNLKAKNDLLNLDKVHFSNVIFNLLDNANKYTPENPIIELSSCDDENYFYLSVKDNGIGISKENQKKIFDKFYRVSTGNLHDVKGFGLGLSYVKRVVELHQGEIRLNSTKGQGTTVIIKILKNGERKN